ncbi:sulfurtransferase [Jeotgalibacillus soli]|uniref:Sulfurtransferase n=1 Tax=Jeotgalibacillus soli TaxID=889306 RepID=A0A0C2RGB4_9BACL|nr:sulfurtransferase [Jeotgalibacillus soli]
MVVIILYLLIVFIAVLSVLLYKRYYPVKGVPCVKKEQLSKDDNITILDLRDYNETADGSSSDSLNIPYAYLKRFHQEIPHKKIHAIASDKVELNLSLRFLASKGFEVNSFSLTNCLCDKKKGEINYGV